MAACTSAMHYSAFLLQSTLTLVEPFKWILFLAILLWVGGLVIIVQHNKTTQIFHADGAPVRDDEQVNTKWARLGTLSPSRIHTPRPNYLLNNHRTLTSPGSSTAARRHMAAGHTPRRQFATPTPRNLPTPSSSTFGTASASGFNPELLAEKAPTSFDTLKQMGMVDATGTPTKKWVTFQQASGYSRSVRSASSSSVCNIFAGDGNFFVKKTKTGKEIVTRGESSDEDEEGNENESSEEESDTSSESERTRAARRRLRERFPRRVGYDSP